MPETDVKDAAQELFDHLARQGVDYLLVGGIAVLSYVAGRNTQDVDLIMDASDAARCFGDFHALDRDFAAASYRGIRVDLLQTTNALFDDIRRSERTQLEFAGRTIPVATRTGLILLKLYALPSLYRQGKLDRAALYETDIQMLQRGLDHDEARMLARLEPYLAAHDIAELRSILRELKEREARRFRS